MRPIGLWLKWNASTTASVASGVGFFDIMRCWVSLYLQQKIKQHHRRACENDEGILVNNQAGFIKENRLDLWNTWWYFDQYLNLLRDIFGWHMPDTSKMSLETYIASTPNNPVTVKSDTLVLTSFSKRKKPRFFATISRVRAFYSSTGCRDFFLKIAMGTIMFPLHPCSKTKPLKHKIMAGRRKNSFLSKNPKHRFRGQPPTPPGIDLILPPGADGR